MIKSAKLSTQNVDETSLSHKSATHDIASNNKKSEQSVDTLRRTSTNGITSEYFQDVISRTRAQQRNLFGPSSLHPGQPLLSIQSSETLENRRCVYEKGVVYEKG
jgi:hypothetical protein